MVLSLSLVLLMNILPSALLPDVEIPPNVIKVDAVPAESPKSEIPLFTPTEVLDEVTPGDNTQNFVGYVDAILGSQTVGKIRQLDLFKFVFNNDDGTKITVLIWEDQIPIYERSIIYREIIELQSVKAPPLEPLYNPRKEGFANFDLSVQRNTKLICHGVFNNVPIQNVVVATIPIKYEAAYKGSSVVEGYISADFSSVTTGSGGCSYATAAISDGQYKLRVQIANSIPSNEITLGTHIRIKGVLKEDKFGTIYLQTEDVTSIAKMTDDKLDTAQLKNCFRAPLKTLPPAT